MSVKFTATFVSCVLLGFALAQSANAADDGFTAKLQKPVTAPVEVIAGQTLWHCSDQTCVTYQFTQGTLSDCYDLVSKVGALDSFGADTHAMPAERLQKCNPRVKKTDAIKN